MSYLLEALRKAERERHRDRVPDLAQLHETDSDDRNGGRASWVVPTILGLVLLNLGVLSVFWLSRDNEAPPPSAAEPTAFEPAVPEKPQPAPEPAPPPVEAYEPESYPEPVEPIEEMPPAAHGELPDIELSGHLYSSIPGRSFILVNGRRYREGERLQEGPAVESIEESGAILNYRGERYRVDAPR